jgi:prevent-host-death family protein
MVAMKNTVNTHEAKTHLSRLLKRVALGEEIVIAVRGKPTARLVSLKEEGAGRKFGTFKGKFEVPDDFDAPLPDDIVDVFEGKPKRARKKK